MKAIRTIVMGLAALTITSAAPAAEHSTINRRTGLYEPPLTELRKASERGDRAELARTASRLGPNRLTKALTDPDRRIVLAALEAAPLFAEGVLLLDGIVPLIGSTDDDVRERATADLAALASAPGSESIFARIAAAAQDESLSVEVRERLKNILDKLPSRPVAPPSLFRTMHPPPPAWAPAAPPPRPGGASK